jgi:hypothetical protein
MTIDSDRDRQTRQARQRSTIKMQSAAGQGRIPSSESKISLAFGVLVCNHPSSWKSDSSVASVSSGDDADQSARALDVDRGAAAFYHEG